MRFALRDVELILNFEYKDKYNISDLLRIMEILRSPDGCPWDREQNHQSIKKNLIEETYEVVEAINKDDKELLCEELGDLLLQIVFHSQMEAEQGVFDFEAVCDGICKKLIERHPHVFGTLEVGGSRGLRKLGADKAPHEEKRHHIRRSGGHTGGAAGIDAKRQDTV